MRRIISVIKEWFNLIVNIKKINNDLNNCLEINKMLVLENEKLITNDIKYKNKNRIIISLVNFLDKQKRVGSGLLLIDSIIKYNKPCYVICGNVQISIAMEVMYRNKLRELNYSISTLKQPEFISIQDLNNAFLSDTRKPFFIDESVIYAIYNMNKQM